YVSRSTSFASLTDMHRYLFRCLHFLGSILNGLDDVDIASATAKISRDTDTNLMLSRVRIALQQCNTRHHHTRRAIATLESMHLMEPFLDRMQAVLLLKSLNGHNLTTIGLYSKHGAGFGSFAIDKDRTSPTS